MIDNDYMVEVTEEHGFLGITLKPEYITLGMEADEKILLKSSNTSRDLFGNIYIFFHKKCLDNIQ